MNEYESCVTKDRSDHDIPHWEDGTLATGRVLDYRDKGDENRKLCSLSLLDGQDGRQARPARLSRRYTCRSKTR